MILGYLAAVTNTIRTLEENNLRRKIKIATADCWFGAQKEAVKEAGVDIFLPENQGIADVVLASLGK